VKHPCPSQGIFPPASRTQGLSVGSVLGMILLIIALALFIAAAVCAVLGRPAGLVAYAALLAAAGGVLLVIGRWV
jgi:hypothetical protein